MQWLKQSTSTTIKLGPFLDETDGKTAETGLTIAQADIRLSKNGGNFAQTNNSSGATHDENGWYGIPLDTTDTNTLGRLIVTVHESGALPVWREFMIVPANMYNSLVSGSDYLQTDTIQIEGSDATDQINAEADTALSDYDPPTKTEMDASVGLIQADISALNDPSAAAVADAVWDETLSDHASTGSTGTALTSAASAAAGAGAIAFTYTLTSSVDSSAIPSADIWVTDDANGSNVIASGTTDTNGQTVFYLDAGTYYVWRQKPGWNFTNPDTETVS